MSTRLWTLLICGLSLNLSTFLSIYSRRLPKFWFPLFLNFLQMFKVTNRKTNFAVGTVTWVRTIDRTSSATQSLTWIGLLQGVENIVTIKCFSCSEFVSICSKSQLSNASCCHWLSFKLFILGSLAWKLKYRSLRWSVYMFRILVERTFLKKVSFTVKLVDSWGQEKITFPQVLSFSVSILSLLVERL